MSSDICSSDGLSPLSDLLISFNRFSGVLNVSYCLNLILLSAAQNNFTDFVNPTEYNRLHTVRLRNNTFPNSKFTVLLENIMEAGHVTNLDISFNRCALYSPGTGVLQWPSCSTTNPRWIPCCVEIPLDS